jgi:Peptidase family M23
VPSGASSGCCCGETDHGNGIGRKSSAPEADRSASRLMIEALARHKRKRRPMPVWLVLELMDRAQCCLGDPTRTGDAAVLAPAFLRKVVLSAPPRCGDRRRPSDCPRTRNRLRGCLFSQRGIPLVVLWLRLLSFGVMLGTGLQSAAVEGFGQQPAGPLNIASEPDSARADDEAGAQPGGSRWSLARNEPRLGEVSAGAGTEVEAANATSPGEPVTAPVSGRVVFAAPFKSYGPLLIIAHGEYYTVLWGFAKLEVMVNDLLAEGQTVGFIGGQSGTPSILHVESRRTGAPRRGRGDQARTGG